MDSEMTLRAAVRLYNIDAIRKFTESTGLRWLGAEAGPLWKIMTPLGSVHARALFAHHAAPVFVDVRLVAESVTDDLAQREQLVEAMAQVEDPDDEHNLFEVVSLHRGIHVPCIRHVIGIAHILGLPTPQRVEAGFADPMAWARCWATSPGRSDEQEENLQAELGYYTPAGGEFPRAISVEGGEVR